MIRCPFCDHKNPTGATHCAECKAELFDPDAAAADAGAGAPSAEANSLDGRVLALVRDGRKIQAIKLYRDITGAGLKEAKDAVEALERDGALSSKRAGAAGAGVDKAEILELLRAGQKIRAIKLYRERSGSGLADAKNAVESLARAEGLPAGGSGCGSAVLSLVAIALVVGYLAAR
jgi:large subunit ribosomal protein L7/L12